VAIDFCLPWSESNLLASHRPANKNTKTPVCIISFHLLLNQHNPGDKADINILVGFNDVHITIYRLH